MSGRSISFSGLEKCSVDGKRVWVQQCWDCAYAVDVEFERWVKSLAEVPTWAALYV
jgi:hypothetical protein